MKYTDREVALQSESAHSWYEGGSDFLLPDLIPVKDFKEGVCHHG